MEETQNAAPSEQTKPPIVIGARLIGESIMHYYKSGIDVAPGNIVVVKTDFGHDAARVIKIIPAFEKYPFAGKNLLPVVRAATPEDLETMRGYSSKALKARKITIEKAREHKLPIKVVVVRYIFDEAKILFYFTAEGRIDFRLLVRDLAAIFHSRIELRQIGARDEACMIGGHGICGMEQCCCRYLPRFIPVTIKMAKDQNLSLNSSKISGNCGRLLCCLQYEHATYCHLRERLPRIGTPVTFYADVVLNNKSLSSDAPLHGKVKDINVIKQTVFVELEGQENAMLEVPVSELGERVNNLAKGDYR